MFHVKPDAAPIRPIPLGDYAPIPAHPPLGGYAGSDRLSLNPMWDAVKPSRS